MVHDINHVFRSQEVLIISKGDFQPVVDVTSAFSGATSITIVCSCDRVLPFRNTKTSDFSSDNRLKSGTQQICGSLYLIAYGSYGASLN